MPTIRRATWRPRKLFGYAVESFKTNDNWELECNYQFRNSDLTDEARALFLKMRLDIWFVRRPGWQTTFATLIHIDAHHDETRELLKSFGPGRLPYVWVSAAYSDRYRKFDGEHEGIFRRPGEGSGYIEYGQYHYSFVAGKVKPYMNGNPEYLWDAVKPEFYWDDVSAEDRAALRAVADELSADF